MDFMHSFTENGLLSSLLVILTDCLGKVLKLIFRLRFLRKLMCKGRTAKTMLTTTECGVKWSTFSTFSFLTLIIKSEARLILRVITMEIYSGLMGGG